VLPDGMSYRVLILPSDETMTPALLKKIRQLIADGATVVGPKPLRSPSLQDYPRCDEEVRSLADEVWGNCDGVKATEHAFGKGKVIWGKPLEEVFAALGVKPDFEVADGETAKERRAEGPRGRGRAGIVKKNERLAYIHRVVGDADIYFVSNQRAKFEEVECAFRVSGKVPELWHPDTGRMEKAPIYTETDGRTSIPLRLDPAGSVFVVFREKATGADHVVAVTSTGAETPRERAAKLEVRRAVYEATDGAGSMDVTEKLAAMVKSGALGVEASNTALGKDPTPMHVKQLRVEYTLDGKPYVKIVRENEYLEIPDVTTGTEVPACELAVTADGKTELKAWKSGVYELKTASGKTSKIEVGEVPKPLEIAGPWELRFPPKWGAPKKVGLEKLISWTEHSEPGVRYFSGTATYTRKIEIPAELAGPDKALYLDLGQVKNLAQVKLNGKDLGILWKPPFLVEITNAARAGTNQLEIQITNLWPNRLIGDEQLPEDCQWNGKQLAEWPKWLLQGKPSPTGRLTFTTWKHYAKDSPLLESGLLGPVRLMAAIRKNVQ
jgi:hypothetical protein